MEQSSAQVPVMYSCAELAKLKLPKHPSTERGWLKRVKAESWPFRDVKAPGRNGQRREYQPPPEIQALIDAGQATYAGQQLANVLHEAERQQGTVFVNVVLLAQLLEAVDALCARKFDKPLPTAVRLGAAIDAYRSIQSYGVTDQLDAISCLNLGPAELEAAATLGLWKADAEKYVGADAPESLMSSIRLPPGKSDQ